MASPYRSAVWLLVLVLLLAFPQEALSSLSIVVESEHEECISLRTPSDKAPAIIRGNYDCLDDELDPYDIRVVLSDSNKDPVWKSAHGESEDVFEVRVETGGRYYFCIENQNSDGEEHNVGFAVRVSPPPRSLEEMEEGPDQERALELVDWSADLLEDWDDLMDHYEYVKEREEIHRNMVERIFERVMRWTLLEAFTLVTIATCQVLYIRKFFETRRYL